MFTIFLDLFATKIRITGISSETTIPGISVPGSPFVKIRETENPFLRRRFPATLRSFRSSLPLLVRCRIRRRAGRLVSYPPGTTTFLRRLSRDSRIPYFSLKNFRKSGKNQFFGLPGPK